MVFIDELSVQPEAAHRRFVVASGGAFFNGRFSGMLVRTMHGVTTAIVAFVFVCIIFPHLVKNRPQFYAAFALAMAIIVLDSVGNMFKPDSAFRAFAYTMCAVFQVCSIILLFLSAGGLTWRELAGDMRDAVEVIRRGEEEKEIIIPLTGQKPRARHDDPDDQPRERYEINDEPPAPPKQQPPQQQQQQDNPGSLPLT